MQFVFLNDQTPSTSLNQIQAVNFVWKAAWVCRCCEARAARTKPQQNDLAVCAGVGAGSRWTLNYPPELFPKPDVIRLLRKTGGTNAAPQALAEEPGSALEFSREPSPHLWLVFTERGGREEGRREGGRKASGKAGASFKSADEELLPGIVLFAPRAMQTRIKIPSFQVCFKKFTYFQASLRSSLFRDGTNTTKCSAWRTRDVSDYLESLSIYRPLRS